MLSARAFPACDAGGISQPAKQMCCLPLGHVKTQACETEAWNRIIVCVCGGSTCVGAFWFPYACVYIRKKKEPLVLWGHGK